MLDVIEHVPWPRDLLSAAAAALRIGGRLYVSTPNRESAWWNALDANPYWNEIEHYHVFSASHLRAVLAEHGFAVESVFVNRRYRLGIDLLARRTDSP